MTYNQRGVSEGTMSQDEDGRLGKSLIIQGLASHAKAFGFHLRANSNPLEDFRQC